jgi:glycosyltransferase involved in cell wall biosynthesis
MKILHFNDNYAEVGGTESYLLSLCQELEARGHESVVVYHNLDQRTLESSQRRSYHVMWPTGLSQIGRGVLKQLVQIIESENPDVINLHNVYEPWVIDVAREKPAVRYVHGTPMCCPGMAKLYRNPFEVCSLPFGPVCALNAYRRRCAPRSPWKLARALLKTYLGTKATSRLAKVIVATTYMKRYLMQNGFDERQLEVLPCFTTLLSLKESRVLPRESWILYVGRVAEEKGLDCLTQALSMIKRTGWKLVVCGDGPSVPAARSLAHRQGLSEQVHLCGWVSQSELAEYYARAAVLVMPSLYPEPLGLAGLEAMSCGTPVVAYDVGGISDWLRDGENGFLVEPGNITQLAERIQQLLQDKGLTHQLGENGRKMVRERFSPERHVKRLLQVYEEVIAHHENLAAF